jgi:hypothetical protein
MVHCCLLLVQVLILYAQWVALVINMPVTWLPWAVHSSESAAGNTAWQQEAMVNSTSATGFSSVVDGALGVLFGRSATIDCFLQAWHFLQGNTMQAVVKNILTRAVGRCVLSDVLWL